MAGLNKVILQGNLVADPDCRVTPNGISVCSFRVAVGRRYAKEGAEVTADFFSVEAWRNVADFVSKHFIKGKPIIIVGSLQNRNWVDQNGQKRYGNVVIADECYFAGDGASSGAAGGHPSPTGVEGSGSEQSSSERVTPNFEELSGEDDLPF